MKQRASVHKFSTDFFLHLLLPNAVYADEIVLDWPGEELMAKYAECLLSRDPVQEGVFRWIDPEIEKDTL